MCTGVLGVYAISLRHTILLHTLYLSFCTDTVGEGQFGQVWEALAVGICPDHSRNVVAVKTLKRETHYLVFTTKKHTTP